MELLYKQERSLVHVAYFFYCDYQIYESLLFEVKIQIYSIS